MKMLHGRFRSSTDRQNESTMVAKCIASITSTLLGNGQRIKCCMSSENMSLICCTPQLLQTIDIQHPAGCIINNVCQSFHHEYGCGSTTLVCMIGFWSDALQDLLDKGVPRVVMLTVLTDIIDDFEIILKKTCISLDQLRDVRLRFNEMKRQVIPFERGCNLSIQKHSSIEDATAKTVYYSDKQSGVLLNERKHSSKFNSFSLKEIDHPNLVNECHAYFEEFNQDEDNTTTGRNCLNTLQEKRFKDVKIGRCSRFMSLNDSGFIPHSNVHFLEEKYSDSRFCFESIAKNTVNVKSIYGVSVNRLSKVGYSKQLTNSRNIHLRSRHLNDCNSSLSVSDCSIQRDKIMVDDMKTTHNHSSNFVNPTHSDAESSQVKERFSADGLSSASTHASPVQGNIMDGTYQRSADAQRLTRELATSPTLCDSSSNPFLTSTGTSPRCREKEGSWLDYLSCGLAHGKELEMSLAVDIVKKQCYWTKNMGGADLNVQKDLINVSIVLGPPQSKSRVLPGVVVQFSDNCPFITKKSVKNARRMALIKGDVSYAYRHPGFKDPVKIAQYSNKDEFCCSSKDGQKKWTNRVLTLIQSFDIGVIALRGKISTDLRDTLQARGVAIIENLSFFQLHLLAKLTECSIVSYILNITERCFGKHVSMRVWDSGWSRGTYLRKSNVNRTVVFGQLYFHSLDEKCVGNVYSAVLCNPIQDLLEDSRLRFLNCLDRLHNAAVDKCVLPGGGEVEMTCIRHIKDVKDYKAEDTALLSRWVQEDYVIFRSLIVNAICSGLRKYVSTLKSNIVEESLLANDSPNQTIGVHLFDNYSSKLEAWKRAIRTVKLFLNSENHIVTGL